MTEEGTPAPSAQKEMYTYKASWQTHSFNFSNRFKAPKHEFRVALGSFIEDYANRIHVSRVDCSRAPLGLILLSRAVRWCWTEVTARAL